MSDSFIDTDDDFADSEFLKELDAIEAAATQPPASNPTQIPASPPLSKQSGRPKFKAAPRKQDSSDEFDETFDVDAEELDKLDAFIADSYAGKTQPVAGPSRTRQTTLDGRTLSLPPSGDAQPKRSFERTKSSGPKEPKIKIWDRTAFSETGFRSTKKKDAKGKEKEKGSGKNAAREGDFDEDFDEEMEFEQFPSPRVEGDPPPPMRLKPDFLAAKDWVYPLNKPRRDYQFNISKKCFFQNTLVALPTGLGKTFIAGVVMLNYYRWFLNGKIIFIAPTKPLVAQQITACHEVCGIPGRDAALLTGEVPKAKRSIAWAQKRVLYMTPQTLTNDLVCGLVDPLDIILLVIDEAHRGTGDYAYCLVVRYLMAKNPHFRILALTATPGNNPEAVQKIVDGLHISHIEIRNEMSFDLQPYLFKKEIEIHVIKMDEAVLRVQESLIKVINPLLDRVRKEGILYARSAIMLHPYSCVVGQKNLGSRKSASWMWSYVRVLGSLARAMGNLMESSTSACYRSLKDLKENLVSGDKNDDKHVHLLRNPDFIKLMEECERQQDLGFAPHPKMKALVEIIMDHFNRPADPDTPAAGESTDPTTSSSTRVMIFVGLREVIDEVVGVLDQYQPMLRAARFVGQGADKKGKKGLAQGKQLETIQKFKSGEYNILVSTSVGEEGLDIGEIDRIICYDSSKSSIQMLQRVGRTGRKRTGYVDVLLSEEREERNWDKSKENYADVQETIISGNQLELYTDAERLLPENIQPSCLQITMPIEKYEPQAKGTPSRSKDTTAKKRKRINDVNRNVPLDAFTGFVPASKLRPKTSKAKKAKKLQDLRGSDLEDDSDDVEIANGLRGVTSSPKKGKLKSSGKAKSKVRQRSLSDLLKTPIPDQLEDDDDDLEIQKGLTLDKGKRLKNASSDSSELSARPRKQRRPLIASSSSSSSDAERTSGRTRNKPTSGPSTSKANLSPARTGSKPKTIGWLLESGSEAEVTPDPSMQRAKLNKPRSTGFRTAKSLGVIETVSSSEEQVEAPDKSSVENSPIQKDMANLVRSPAVPEPTYAVGLLAKRKRAVKPAAPPSSPVDERTDLPRRLVRRRSPSLMPPPPAPEPRDRRPRNPKLKMKDNPMLFDVEAIHSGDEMSGGDSSDVDMVESDSDRRFLQELPETQIPQSYNQTAAYRMGLLTQAPDDGSGPIFKAKKKRAGAFAGGRTQVPKPADWGSSPIRSSEPDEYEMGSFVVNDDDAVLYDQSSEP